jgi:hypothetical protein
MAVGVRVAVGVVMVFARTRPMIVPAAVYFVAVRGDEALDTEQPKFAPAMCMASGMTWKNEAPSITPAEMLR